jgi:hypothetical protein
MQVNLDFIVENLDILFIKYQIVQIRNLTSTSKVLSFKTLEVTSPSEYVFHVKFNRPEKRNAMNPTFF